MKAPSVGRRLSGNRLTVGVSAVNLKVRIQDMHSLTRNQPYFATASPMRCKFGLGLWQNIRKINRSCLMNRVIPRTTRKPNWNHVDRGNLVQHTVTTMLERAVVTFKQTYGRLK